MEELNYRARVRLNLPTWSLLRYFWNAATSVHLRTFALTASCMNDTKKKQLVVRSGLSRLRCCVCLLHDKRAMNSPAAGGEFFKTLFQQAYQVDVGAGDAHAAAYVSQTPHSRKRTGYLSPNRPTKKVKMKMKIR